MNGVILHITNMVNEDSLIGSSSVLLSCKDLGGTFNQSVSRSLLDQIYTVVLSCLNTGPECFNSDLWGSIGGQYLHTIACAQFPLQYQYSDIAEKTLMECFYWLIIG